MATKGCGYVVAYNYNTNILYWAIAYSDEH